MIDQIIDIVAEIVIAKWIAYSLFVALDKLEGQLYGLKGRLVYLITLLFDWRVFACRQKFFAAKVLLLHLLLLFVDYLYFEVV